MNSIFTQIINGDIPCYKVAETTNCFAFLDINPNAFGHTLCIPKKEVDLIFDLEDKDYEDLMNFSNKIAKALKNVKNKITIIDKELNPTEYPLKPKAEVADDIIAELIKRSDG